MGGGGASAFGRLGGGGGGFARSVSAFVSSARAIHLARALWMGGPLAGRCSAGRCSAGPAAAIAGPDWRDFAPVNPGRRGRRQRQLLAP